MVFSVPWLEDQVTRSHLRNSYVNDAIRTPEVPERLMGRHVNDNWARIDVRMTVDSLKQI